MFDRSALEDIRDFEKARPELDAARRAWMRSEQMLDLEDLSLVDQRELWEARRETLKAVSMDELRAAAERTGCQTFAQMVEAKAKMQEHQAGDRDRSQSWNR